MSLQKESVSEKLVRRDSEELRKNGEQLKDICLQKESEWEKNPIRYEEGMPVENESGIYPVREGWNMDEWTVSFVAETLHFAQTESIGEDASFLTRKLRKKIKEAITTAVSTREKEIAEEVKDSFWECPTHGEPNPPTNCRDCNECLEVNVVLSNVLKILQH